MAIEVQESFYRQIDAVAVEGRRAHRLVLQGPALPALRLEGRQGGEWSQGDQGELAGPAGLLQPGRRRRAQPPGQADRRLPVQGRPVRALRPHRRPHRLRLSPAHPRQLALLRLRPERLAGSSDLRPTAAGPKPGSASDSTRPSPYDGGHVSRRRLVLLAELPESRVQRIHPHLDTGTRERRRRGRNQPLRGGPRLALIPGAHSSTRCSSSPSATPARTGAAAARTLHRRSTTPRQSPTTASASPSSARYSQ